MPYRHSAAELKSCASELKSCPTELWYLAAEYSETELYFQLYKVIIAETKDF